MFLLLLRLLQLHLMYLNCQPSSTTPAKPAGAALSRLPDRSSPACCSSSRPCFLSALLKPDAVARPDDSSTSLASALSNRGCFSSLKHISKDPRMPDRSRLQPSHPGVYPCRFRPTCMVLLHDYAASSPPSAYGSDERTEIRIGVSRPGISGSGLFGSSLHRVYELPIPPLTLHQPPHSPGFDYSFRRPHQHRATLLLSTWCHVSPLGVHSVFRLACLLGLPLQNLLAEWYTL